MHSVMSVDGIDEADKFVINVGGVRFETFVTTLQNIADTRLSWLTENRGDKQQVVEEFFFDRHPGVFVHILNFYRTGKLHTPRDVCGPLFFEELQFWGIDEKQMEPCCWEAYTKHREAEENLRSFQGPYFEDLKPMRKHSHVVIDPSQGSWARRKREVWDIVDDPYSSQLAKRFSYLSCMMICISIAVYCITTMPQVQGNKTASFVFRSINYVCLTFFTLELFTRIITSPNKVQFVRDYQNWLDFVSVIPSYLLLIFPENAFIQNLVIIRLLRVIKFFKLSYGLQVFMQTLKSSSYELTLLLFLLLIPVIIFSSLVYAVEHHINGPKSSFDSIPTAFWWCLITITTIGYGDLTPETIPGRFFGSLCAIIGVLIVALPISVIGSNFTVYYAHVKARLKLPKKHRQVLGGNLRGLLRHPAALSSRDRDRRTIRRSGNIRHRDMGSSAPEDVRRRQYAYEVIVDESDVDKVDTDVVNNYGVSEDYARYMKIEEANRYALWDTHSDDKTSHEDEGAVAQVQTLDSRTVTSNSLENESSTVALSSEEEDNVLPEEEEHEKKNGEEPDSFHWLNIQASKGFRDDFCGRESSRNRRRDSSRNFNEDISRNFTAERMSPVRERRNGSTCMAEVGETSSQVFLGRSNEREKRRNDSACIVEEGETSCLVFSECSNETDSNDSIRRKGKCSAARRKTDSRKPPRNAKRKCRKHSGSTKSQSPRTKGDCSKLKDNHDSIEMDAYNNNNNNEDKNNNPSSPQRRASMKMLEFHNHQLSDHLQVGGQSSAQPDNRFKRSATLPPKRYKDYTGGLQESVSTAMLARRTVSDSVSLNETVH